LLGRFADPGARLVAVAISVGVLLIVQVVVLVWGGVLAAIEGDRAVDDSFAYLADVSEERVVAYAQSTENVAVETVKSLEFEDPGAQELIATLHGAVTSRSQVDAVAVIYPDGTYAELAKSRSGRGGYSSHVISVDQNIQLSHHLTDYDSQMRVTASTSVSLDRDPRTTGCYRRATLSLPSVWSKPEVDPLTGLVRVWACKAARRASGEIFAVVAVSMNLQELGQSLNALPAGSDGQVFLFAKDRELLAVPPTMSATWDDLSTRIGTPPLGEFLGVETDKRVAAGASADVFGKHGKLVVLERDLGGDHLDWVVHLRATEFGVNEGFTRMRTTVIAIAVGLVALTVGIGYLLSQMWRPLINVRKVAERDPLTGLYNRHQVAARITRTMDSARRGGHEAVVIMLDIDNFKELNDELGHTSGDQALEDISAVLANQTRASDMAVRWGGDEFLVVLRLPVAIDAAGAVERIRSRAEQALNDRFKGREGLGVTAGFVVSSDGEVDIDALIAAADAALIDGKSLKKGVTYGV